MTVIFGEMDRIEQLIIDIPDTDGEILTKLKGQTRRLFGFSYNEKLRLKLLGKEDSQTEVESGVLYSYSKRGLELTVLRGNLLEVRFVPVSSPEYQSAIVGNRGHGNRETGGNRGRETGDRRNFPGFPREQKRPRSTNDAWLVSLASSFLNAPIM